MYKHTLVFCAYLLITCFTAFAQRGQKTFDQYYRGTKDLKEDTNKVLRYLEFAKMPGPLATTMFPINRAAELSIELHYKKGIESSAFLLNQKIYPQFKKEAKDLKADTNKVLCYLKFAALLEHSPDTALVILKKAKYLSIKLNYQREIGRA